MNARGSGAAWARSPWLLFALIIVLSIPFDVLGAVSGKVLPAHLPIAALQVVCPLIAALVLVGWADGRAGVRRLLARLVDLPRRGPSRTRWYLVAVATIPLITLVAYGIDLVAHRPVPTAGVSLFAAVGAIALFLILAACEEIAWSGCAIDPLQDRWGAKPASLLVGLVWAAIHVVPWLQLHDPAWVFWQFVFTVAARVVMVRIYNAAGRSVLAVILFHAMINFCYAVTETAYDPMIVGLLTTAVAIVVLVRPTGRTSLP
ncbi:MAG TPA: CPBP family intramembrane glutamic endopeptidase [Pseudonocardiaceae bacterium]